MDKDLQNKLTNIINELKDKIFKIEKTIKQQEKEIDQLQKVIKNQVSKQDLIRMQKRINTLEAELQDITNYVNRKR